MTISAPALSIAERDAVFGELAQHPELLNGGKIKPRIDYSSGAITTRGTFKQRYGYFEIRASWSGGKGVWPAFWLLPADGSWPPEIDVVEAHGDKPALCSSRSIRRASRLSPMSSTEFLAARFSHVWRFMDAGPDRFFVDGVRTSTTPETVDMKQPMYILANLAIGGVWPGYPNPTQTCRVNGD